MQKTIYTLVGRSFVAVALLYLPAALAQEEGVIQLSDRVTGNQEQPQVLYIVPWQSPADDSILNQQVQTQLNQDVFNHIERSEHVREINYRLQLQQTD